MKHLLDLPEEQASFIDHITQLAQSIINHHDKISLAHAVLHHLGQEQGFNFKKIAYLINNPDFNHTIGVTGFNAQECNSHSDNLWNDLDAFAHHMKETPFHNQVASLAEGSSSKNQKELIQSVAKSLNMPHCECIMWDMKHGNFGLFLFEPSSNLSPSLKKILENTVSLLSFCPIHS